MCVCVCVYPDMETSRLREFLGALDRGDEAALRQILLDDEDHILVTSRYNEGETALHIASRLGHIECMLTLIKCGKVDQLICGFGPYTS